MYPDVVNLGELYKQGRITRREFIRRAAFLGLSMSAISSFLAACAPTPAPEETPAVAAPTPTPVPPTATPPPTEAPAEPKILRIRLWSETTNMDPAFHPGEADTMPASCIFNGLVTNIPGTWDVVNELAESIELSEDGLRTDFKLKEGVQFHGGYGELTAEDVKFSYERFIDPELGSPYAGDWEPLDHVEVTGKYTGTIILNNPFAPLFVSTLPVSGGWILSKKAVEERGLEGFATGPIGTGPYEVAEFVPKQKLVLKRFEDYWGELPEWDEIHFLMILEDSAAEIALETGEADYGNIALDAVERFEANDEFEVIKVDTLNYDALFMNVQHPNLQDINVRQAIRYAIDVPPILEAAYEGKAARACALLGPAQMGYWADAPCYERDVEKATEFMAKAGLETLDLTLTVENRELERVAAEVIQANLADIGINVEIITQDPAAYWEGGFGEKGLQERQLTYIVWTTLSPDPYWWTCWFTCDQVQEWNWMYWCNEEFDRLHYAALAELDPAKRVEMYIQMQKVWDEAVNSVSVAHPTRYFAVRVGIEPSLTPNARAIPWDFHSK